MSRAIRAIYEDGHLRLLDPVELSEGEQVQITIGHQFSLFWNTLSKSAARDGDKPLLGQ